MFHTVNTLWDTVLFPAGIVDVLEGIAISERQRTLYFAHHDDYKNSITSGVLIEQKGSFLAHYQIVANPRGTPINMAVDDKQG